MGSNRTSVNVSVWRPDESVASMQGLIEEGSVETAVRAAIAAFAPLNSGAVVEEVTYAEDFDNAVATAMAHAGDTDGRDLLVVVTDLVCDNPGRAEDLLLGGLAESDDFVVIVPVGDYDENWAEVLNEGESKESDRVDVVRPDELGDPNVALREVGPWAQKAA